MRPLKLAKLIKFSPKRNSLFDETKAANTDNLEYLAGIQTFCQTRWTVQGKSIASILNNSHNLK